MTAKIQYPKDTRKPLRGVKVLDLTQGVAGPYSTMLLAINGADVIKVEPPEGDWCRVLGYATGQESVNSLAVNRGKRSICLDVKSAAGKDVLARIAADADVFVESFRPGVAARLGLGYEDLKKLNPDIIYVSVSGFGQSGPAAMRPGVDGLIQAYSGMMAMNESPQGEPSRIPMIVIDMATALYCSQAMNTALIQKFRFGEGAYLDINLVQSAAAFQSAKIMEFVQSGGESPQLYAPSGCFCTKAGHLYVTGMRAAHFAAICKVLGREDLLHDSRWPTQNDRTKHAKILNAEIAKAFLRRTAKEWVADLQSAGVMAEEVQDYGAWLQQEHVRAIDAFQWVQTPALGRLPFVAVPGVLPDGDKVTEDAPPLKGEHSRAILKQLGFSSGWIEEQIGCGTIQETVRERTPA